MTAGGVAIDLDGTMADTRPLWNDWLASAEGILGIDRNALPADRGEAAAELDRVGAGNWRVLLERFAEERVAVYLRREAAASIALKTLAEDRREIGVYTDAPEPLAKVALAHLGMERRVVALETGSGALERLLEQLGADAVVVRSRAELLELAAA